MVGWGDERLATLIFHELAHQRFYVQDDTEFNESFASFVEQEGTRQWRAAWAGSGRAGAAGNQFIRLVLASRERLQAIYAGPLDDAHKRGQAGGVRAFAARVPQVRMASGRGQAL
jgi:predicted aminopeptidase